MKTGPNHLVGGIPSTHVIAAHRLAFGPGVGTESLTDGRLSGWLDEQLRPDEPADRDCARRVSEAKLEIKYAAGEEDGQKWPAMHEQRPLSSLDRPIRDMWHLTDWSKKTNYAERVRPFQEVFVATWIRAVYSRYPLREVLVDFWHNHFSVNVEVDVAVQIAMPAYDRDVIRKHCFGNFRQFLEAVATSTAMLRYLNNGASRASPANENYARELFELHTLGQPAYLNHLYNRWRDVPGAVEGKPTGYIDQDVYEAARAFTGWTYGSGEYARDGEDFPDTGEFIYFEPWHDNNQKRVLGEEFEPNQPPMADGRHVLDLVARHPATARHICTKLCKRLVSDNPTDDVVNAAVATWSDALDAPDQIARTIRTIVLSDAFARTWGQKVKRPLEFTAALLRSSGAEFTPDWNFIWAMGNTNQKLFEWPTPAGHPDDRDYWLSASTMLNRWTIPLAAIQGWWSSVGTTLLRSTPQDRITPRQLTEYWSTRMLGYLPDEPTYSTLVQFTSGENEPDEPLKGGDRETLSRLTDLVSLIAMTPEFHLR